jgi:hypothetical protein
VTPAEKDQLVRRLAAGKRRAKLRRRRELQRVEGHMEYLGARYREAKANGASPTDLGAIIRDLRNWGLERERLLSSQEGG